MIRLERTDQLDAESYRRIVLEHEEVAVAPALLDAVDAARARMLAHLATGVTAYGVNTSLGFWPGRRSSRRSSARSSAASCSAAPARDRRSRRRWCAARC